MSGKNILYIGNYNKSLGIHNFKWINHFSQNPENNIFVINSGPQLLNTKEELEQLYNNNIFYLPNLNDFSIASPRLTIISIFKLNAFIKLYKIDIVHIFYAAPNALWNLFIKCPTIITTRGSDVLITIPALSKGKIKEKIHFMFFKFSFKKANIITSTSDRQINNILRIFKLNKKPVLIRTGVDIKKITAIDADFSLPIDLIGKNIIFFPRYLEPIYNHELEIESLKLLNREILENHFLVFIKNIHKEYNKYANEILNSLEKLNLKYIVLNNITQSEMFSIYKKAKLCVMVPLSDGTPNTALEAMAAKCPLIIGAFEYDNIFENSSLKISKYSPKELSEKMLIALSNYPNNLLESGLECANNYGNIDIELQKIELEYSKLSNNEIQLKNDKKILLTFDYEVFLKKSGNIIDTLIKPTNILLNLLSHNNIKATFFIDILFYKRLIEHPNCLEESLMIREQIQNILYLGHSIELHLHPHWLYSKYELGQWYYNSNSLFKLSDLDETYITDLFVTGKQLLCDIAQPVDPKYSPVAFRAGGLCIQPFDKLKNGFIKTGITIDSSVAKGLKINSIYHSYDFTSYPELDAYKFNSDLSIPVNGGKFTEIPLFTYETNPFLKVYDKYCKLKFPTTYTFNNSDGRALPPEGDNDVLLKKLQSSRVILDLDFCNPLFLSKIIENSDSKLFNLIGHPKLINSLSFLSIKKLITDKYTFTTLSEIKKSL